MKYCKSYGVFPEKPRRCSALEAREVSETIIVALVFIVLILLFLIYYLFTRIVKRILSAPSDIEHKKTQSVFSNLEAPNLSNRDLPLFQSSSIPSVHGRNGLSRKAYANKRRRDFVEQLKKTSRIVLEHVGGVIYRTPSGTRVGIPFATESNRNRWWLGLQESDFEQALLLCEDKGGEIISLSLRKDFFEKHGRRLSVSKGNVKFNVVRRGTSLELLVSRVRVDVDNYTNLF